MFFCLLLLICVVSSAWSQSEVIAQHPVTEQVVRRKLTRFVLSQKDLKAVKAVDFETYQFPLGPVTAPKVVKALTSKEAINQITTFSQGKSPLYLFDYDGTLGRGDGLPGSPDRYNENGEWQPRCPILLAFYQQLKQDCPKHTWILSAGTSFVFEQEHFVAGDRKKEHFLTKEKMNGLYSLASVGYYAHANTNIGNCKGQKLEGIVSLLKEQYVDFDSIVFLDDNKAYSIWVAYYAHKLDLPVLSLYWPFSGK